MRAVGDVLLGRVLCALDAVLPGVLDPVTSRASAMMNKLIDVPCTVMQKREG